MQHCREAEKRSKSLGRDRVTIRVLFNSGQYVQWTCPWSYLHILTKYRDRDGINTQEKIENNSPKTPNWNHIYTDWATLKARHAIQPSGNGSKKMAIAIFDLYFDQAGTRFESQWDYLTGDNSVKAIVNWINDLIEVGWHLCRKQ